MPSDSARRIQIVAHRGASGYAPEITLEAYRLALEMKADFVEMDIRMLRDGTLVAIHDPDVKRTTNGTGRISEFTPGELKVLDAGSWFNKANPQKARPEYAGLQVPTLHEIINLVKESPAGFYIEIKDPEMYSPDFESSLLSVIHNARLQRRTRILSFSAASIRKIKALDSSIQTALLISRRERDPVKATLRVPADELAIRHDLATTPIIDAAHENGLAVSVWTVDREHDLERMIRIGVDRIITNYPDIVRRRIEAHPGHPGSDRHKFLTYL
jgi:glycerophosphoryl diester phosphodiesterase